MKKLLLLMFTFILTMGINVGRAQTAGQNHRNVANESPLYGATPLETEIYSTDFSGSNPLNGWTIINSNHDDAEWKIEDGYNGVSYNGNLATGAADDWLITPPISLEADNDYLIRYTVSQAGAFEADQLEIKWGTASIEMAMTNSLATETIDMNSGTTDKVIRMSCTVASTTYIGIHLTTPTPNGIISIEKISITKVAKAQPMSVDGFKVTSDADKKTVTLEWKNPTLDVTNAPIVSPLNILIYENDTKIANLQDRTTGAKETYSYNPVNFAGKVTYKIIASIDGNESSPVEYTINLDDIQGEAVAVCEYKTANDYTSWVIENADGGTTWQYIYSNEGGLSMGYAKSCNDWAISPGIHLEKDKRYIIMFGMSTSSNYASNMNIWLGNSQSSGGMTTELMSLTNVYNNGFVPTTTQQFSVEEDGIYYIGFQATKVENKLQLNDIGIYNIQPIQEVVINEYPYLENFDKNELTPSGWKIDRSSDEFGFYVRKLPEASWIYMQAYSRPNALLANGNAPAEREEVIYTPTFVFQKGKSYTISFMLNMYQQNSKNVIELYKATGQNMESIVGEPILLTDETTNMTNWVKHNVKLTVDEDTEYCFAIRVSNEGTGGDIKIDDFSVEEEINVVPVKPAAITNVQAFVYNLNQSVIFKWNHPLEDINGNTISAGSVIKTQIYDGDELIAEPTIVMPDPTELDPAVGLAANYTYTYTDYHKFFGQKIYKFIPSIETEVGPATSCVVSISSFTDGHLKEHKYTADFTEGDNDWTAIDADNDNNTWEYSESAMTTNGKDEWLISPEITLTQDKSYYVLCKFKTDLNQSVNITFTRGNGQTIEDQTEIIHSFNDVIMNEYVVLEIGTNFNADEESNYFGIHVENANGTKVQISDFTIMRLFTQDEPEELPYEENFENIIDLNQATLFTNKWGRRTSSSELFKITTMPDNTVPAHSGEYAAVANEYTLGARTETIFTPYFPLQQGKSYEVSFYLYMPGNGENITTAQIILAYTQDESGIELPILKTITDPVTEWTKVSAAFIAEYEMEHCFYLEFTAAAANSGIIAVDDFKIEEIPDISGIENVAQNGNMYYDAATATLYLPDGIENVSVFNLQGQLLINAQPANGTLSLGNLNEGFYVVKAINADGITNSLKIMKK